MTIRKLVYFVYFVKRLVRGPAGAGRAAEP